MTTTRQPMSSFVMIETAKRLLSAAWATAQADNVVRSDRFKDIDGEERFQAVRFDAAGNPTLGWWAPGCDWDYQSDILEGQSGTFYPAS